MSTTPTEKEVYNSEIKKRSDEELLEEEIRNQQTIDIFIKSKKNVFVNTTQVKFKTNTGTVIKYLIDA